MTTSALGLALTWPRPVLLVEADPTGGSAVLAGYFRGVTAHTTGLIDLAWAHREGLLEDALAELPMPIPDSSASLLPGVRAHTQARSLAALWEPLAAALKRLDRTGRDVIVDAGRLGLTGSPEPLIYGSGPDVVGDALRPGGVGGGAVVGGDAAGRVRCSWDAGPGAGTAGGGGPALQRP